MLGLIRKCAISLCNEAFCLFVSAVGRLFHHFNDFQSINPVDFSDPSTFPIAVFTCAVESFNVYQID